MICLVLSSLLQMFSSPFILRYLALKFSYHHKRKCYENNSCAFQEEECFSVKDGLCHPSITPEALKGSLLPLVECGTLVRR